jgi:hypothetical protein
MLFWAPLAPGQIARAWSADGGLSQSAREPADLLRKPQIGSGRGDNRRSTSAADSDDSSLKTRSAKAISGEFKSPSGDAWINRTYFVRSSRQAAETPRDEVLGGGHKFGKVARRS